MVASESLTVPEFRRRVVAGSFPEFSSLSSALSGLRFVQADPIRSPTRAQDLILRQRVRGYRGGDLERDFPDLEAEEGFLFAYGFMRRDVWRDLRWSGKAKRSRLEQKLLALVEELGEMHPRGWDEKLGKRSVRNYWGGKSQATKRMLEDLHDDGWLRVCRREKGIRIYQVPPDDRNESETIDPEERYARLVLTTAQVFGPTTKRFLISELKALNRMVPTRKQREACIDRLVDSGLLSEVLVGGIPYLWRREEWQADSIPERVRIVCPFDPLVRDRQRFEQLWGWPYRFEAYVPAAKRERGYYAMPLLWREQVIGWANARVHQGKLVVEIGYVGTPPRERAFRAAVESEVESMTIFLGLESGAWELDLGTGR